MKIARLRQDEFLHETHVISNLKIRDLLPIYKLVGLLYLSIELTSSAISIIDSDFRFFSPNLDNFYSNNSF